MPEENKTAETSPRLFGNPLWLLLLGLFFLGAYFLASHAFDNFVQPSVNYLSIHNAQPLGIVARPYDRDYDRHYLLANLWKHLLLLPAAIFLTLWLAHAIPPDRAKRFSNRLAKLTPLEGLSLTTVIILAALVFISQGIFRNQPVYDDERAYDFQARVLLTGHYSATPPPGADSLKNHMIVVKDGKWLGKYAPGHSAVIALGRLAGHPRLATILLALAIPLLIFFIGRHQYDTRTGLLAAGLFALSPLYLYLSASLMSHVTSLFFLTLFIFGFQRSTPGRSPLYALLAGLALGAAFNTRPQDAPGYAIPFAVIALIQLLRASRPQRAAILLRHTIMLVGFLILVGFFLHYNKTVTGHYLKTPYDFYREKATANIQSIESKIDPDEQKQLDRINAKQSRTTLKRAYYPLIRYARMNLWLFGWPISLLFLFSYLARGQARRADLPFLAIGAGHALFYALYYKFRGGNIGVLELGARDYFPLLVPILLLSAREMLALHRYLASRQTDTAPLRPTLLVPGFVLISAAIALPTFHAETASHLRAVADAVARPYELIENANIHNAIIQMEAKPASGWVFGIRNNSPDLSDDILYINAQNPHDLLEFAKGQSQRGIYVLGANPHHGGLTLTQITREALGKHIETLEKQPESHEGHDRELSQEPHDE